ncbi:MAG: hypothetical protein QF511_06580 [Rhodospirillales bacterium]|nr:hypothetical protein [Rhodospirillales bacterium]MDP7216316.1 hypothetical protein [Rhodospirillales bacterium]
MRSSILGAMSYLGILCFVPLMMNDDDEFIYFHAKQGLVIWIWSVLAVFAFPFPGIGKWLFGLSALAVLVFSALGLISVLLRRAWKLPLVHAIAVRI